MIVSVITVPQDLEFIKEVAKIHMSDIPTQFARKVEQAAKIAEETIYGTAYEWISVFADRGSTTKYVIRVGTAKDGRDYEVDFTYDQNEQVRFIEKITLTYIRTTHSEKIICTRLSIE